MRFTRVTLLFISIIITLGFYLLARNFLAEVEPQTFQATEEMMVESAHLLAESITSDMQGDAFQTENLRKAFDAAHARRFDAQIFNHLKQQVGINAYLTDAKGIVIFDSDGGRREGLDYSRYLDVARTLAGRYGARSTRADPDDSMSSIMYVAAPVGDPKHPLGVLSVFKPKSDLMQLVHQRRNIIYTACGLIGGGILFFVTAVFLWVFHPIGKITEYARAIERGERPAKPNIGIGREVNTLARALDSMRDALEDRKYVERYIQTLTHEMKSPLAAIRGAAELLDEEMPIETRQRFLGNIRAESARSERLINRLLELAALESRSRLESSEELDFRDTLARAVDQAKPLADIAGVNFQVELGTTPAIVHGDAFILRAAVTNLLENAIDFSPRGHVIEVSLSAGEDFMNLSIRDFGVGIPDYAKDKVFERFYSLRHHSVGRKGTGLGLTLVKEAADLHGGSITLSSADGGGTLAVFVLPLR